MSKKIIALFINSLMLILMSVVAVFGQESKVAVKDRRITIQMDQRSLYSVFWNLIQKYDVTIGLEESSLDRDRGHYYFETNRLTEKYLPVYKDSAQPFPGFRENLITVNYTDAKLEVVINDIVKQMKNYSWEIDDDVVNIFPIRGRDERLKKLLDRPIAKFRAGVGADVGSIQPQIMLFLPEFTTFARENNLEIKTDSPASDFEALILPNGLAYNNMTFKHLLNAITKSKRGGWMLQIQNQAENPDKQFIRILI